MIISGSRGSSTAYHKRQYKSRSGRESATDVSRSDASTGSEQFDLSSEIEKGPSHLNNLASLDCQAFKIVGRIFWRDMALRWSRYGLTAGRIWNDRAGIHQISLFSAYTRAWYAVHA
jgi:hypothetical protein